MLAIVIIHIKHYLKLGLRLLLFLFILALLYSMYQYQVTLFGLTLTNPVYNYFEWWVTLILFIIALCLLCSLLLIIVFAYLTVQREKREKVYTRLFNFFVASIVDYLYSEKYRDVKERNALFKRINKFGKRKLNSEALFYAIIRVDEAVTVDNSAALRLLINETGLEKRVIQLLYSVRLSDKIIALKMLGCIRIRDEKLFRKVLSYSESGNFALRNESYFVIIRLMKNGSELSKFITNRQRLSVFDINLLVNTILNSTNLTIDYLSMLSSYFERKLVAGLLLAKYRYRENPKSLILIINQLGNKSFLLNRMAWDAFLTLSPKNEAVDIVIDRFEKEPDDVKALIIKSMCNANSDRFYEFLKKVIEKEPLHIKLSAMAILFREKFELISAFRSSPDPIIKMVYKEVSDLNIELT